VEDLHPTPDKAKHIRQVPASQIEVFFVTVKAAPWSPQVSSNASPACVQMAKTAAKANSTFLIST
jgi:hypothetical protein